MTKQILPTVNKYLFALGLRNLGDDKFGYVTELNCTPDDAELQGQALVVDQTDENDDPIWEELEATVGEFDDELLFVIPEQCIDDQGWLTMRWRWKTTAPANVESSKWAERTENFTPVGYKR